MLNVLDTQFSVLIFAAVLIGLVSNGKAAQSRNPLIDNYRGDPYADLGVKPDQSLDSIKQQFRKRMMEAHPDRSGSEELSKKLNAAYRYIKKTHNQNGLGRYSSSKVSKTSNPIAEKANADINNSIDRNQYSKATKEVFSQALRPDILENSEVLKKILKFDTLIKYQNFVAAAQADALVSVFQFFEILAEFDTKELQQSLLLGLRLRQSQIEFEYQVNRTYPEDFAENDRQEREYFDLLKEFRSESQIEALKQLILSRFTIEPFALKYVAQFQEPFLLDSLTIKLREREKWGYQGRKIDSVWFADQLNSIEKQERQKMEASLKTQDIKNYSHSSDFQSYLLSPFKRRLMRKILWEKFDWIIINDPENNEYRQIVIKLRSILDHQGNQCSLALLPE